MHKLSIDLISKYSDILQAGPSAPNHKVTVWRGDKNNAYENFPFVLPEITRITVERRWNMAADELDVELSNVNGYYSPDYSPEKIYKNVGSLPLSGYKNVFRAYNRVECDLGYGDALVRMFTGQLQSIDIKENPPIIKFNALNVYRKLLKPIDPVKTRELVYEGETAFNIVKDLCKRAGIDELVYDNETIIKLLDATENNTDGNQWQESDFSIDKIKFQLGMNYSDAIKNILEIMDHRITGGRYGEIRILKNENYSQQDFHNWEFDDFIDISEGAYKIDPGTLRNRVIIMSADGWQAFEDPTLIDYCNGEIIPAGLEVKWAATLEQKWAVADHFFLSMRRRLRRISVAVRGNPSMDIGDLVKMRMLTSTANGKYMIVALQSDYSGRGYVDQVDLEYTVAGTGHLCEPAEGEYEASEDDLGGEEASVVVMTLRDKIVEYAMSFYHQGIYYQWGGNYPDSGYGLDCSHFTYQVLKRFGLIQGYKTAASQKSWCNLIKRDALLPGDLVFYTWGGSTVKHVVMYIGNGQIIGANGGGPNTTTKGIAMRQGAKIKIQRIDYGPPAYFGRPPGLV